MNQGETPERFGDSPNRRSTMIAHNKLIGGNTMRSLLGLGLLMTLCASASAATVHHPRHHVIAGRALDYAVLRRAYAAVGPAVRYNDTPSYDDPSRFGGGEALPIKN